MTDRELLELAAKAAGIELRQLHDENEVLRAEVERLRKALTEMISWFPSADTYRRLGFDPEAPMRALKEAKATLAKEDKR